LEKKHSYQLLILLSLTSGSILSYSKGFFLVVLICPEIQNSILKQQLSTGEVSKPVTIRDFNGALASKAFE